MSENVMIRVNYNLREAKAKKPTPINAVIRWQGNRIVYSTLISILPQHWDKKKQLTKYVTGNPMAGDINQSLFQLKEKITTTYLSLKPTINQIKNHKLKEALDNAIGRTGDNNSEYIKFVDAFIITSSYSLNDSGVLMSPLTIKRYRTTHKVVQEYFKAIGKILDWEDFDKNFFDDFKSYLTQKDYKTNTVAKHITTLKRFISEAENKGIRVNSDYKMKGTSAKVVQSYDVYLSESELEKIALVNLSSHLDRVRDLFLIACYTGLRYSDWNSIKNGIDNNQYIIIVQHKTKELVTIPIHPEVKRILHKYGNDTPKIISNQKFNEKIKIVCKEAGIVQNVSYPEFKGGKVETVITPKFKMISAHTARRTFATNEFKRGTQPETIMKITGHKSIKSFMIYLKLDNKEHAELMAKNWQNNGRVE